MSVRPARLVTPISSTRQSALRGRTRSWCACSGPPRRSAPREERLGRARVLRVHDVQARAAEQLVRQVVEQVADGRADVADDERVVDDHDDVGDVLEEQLRPLLALPQRLLGAAPLPALAGAIDRRQQLLGRHRLDQVVVGALPQRVQRALDAGVAGQHDRLRQLGQGRQPVDDLDAVHVGQLEVDQRHRRQLLLDQREAFARALGHQGVVAAPAQDVAQGTQQMAVVLDDEDRELTARRHAASCGHAEGDRRVRTTETARVRMQRKGPTRCRPECASSPTRVATIFGWQIVVRAARRRGRVACR